MIFAPTAVTLTDWVVRSKSVTPSCASSFFIVCGEGRLADTTRGGGTAKMTVIGKGGDVT